MRTPLALLVPFLLAQPVLAGQPELDYAVNRVLEAEGALFVSRHIDENGKISVLFGANEPEWRMRNTVKALQSHPDIAPRLFWARIDTEFCAIR